MKRIFIYALFLSCLASCTAERLPLRTDVGTISVTLAAETGSQTQTKALTALTPEQAAGYTIGIYNEDGTRARYNDTDQEIGDAPYSSFETVEVALYQSYYVTAYSCTPEEAEQANGGKGGPRFEGRSGVFTLNASNISENARVECSQTNAKVTVVFDETVAGRFSDLKVALKSGSRELTVKESDGTTVLYFNPAGMTYSVTGTYKATDDLGGLGSVGVSLSGSQTLVAKDNYRLVIRLNMDYGKADVPSIEVDEVFYNEDEVSGTFDPYDYEN